MNYTLYLYYNNIKKSIPIDVDFTIIIMSYFTDGAETCDINISDTCYAAAYCYQNNNDKRNQLSWRRFENRCYVCSEITLPSHVEGCRNKGLEVPVIKCECNIRVKSMFLPLCKGCNNLVKNFSRVLYHQENIQNGMLFRLSTKNIHDGAYIMYSRISNEKEILTRPDSSISGITESESSNSLNNSNHGTIYDVNMVTGFDVQKLEILYCPICGFNNEIYCFQAQNHISTHEEWVEMCPNPYCEASRNNIRSLNKIRFWSIFYQYDTNKIKIRNTISDSTDLFFDRKVQHPLNDYKRGRKVEEENFHDFPEQWFTSNTDAKALKLSVLKLIKFMKQTHLPIEIIPTQGKELLQMVKEMNLVTHFSYKDLENLKNDDASNLQKCESNVSIITDATKELSKPNNNLNTIKKNEGEKSSSMDCSIEF